MGNIFSSRKKQEAPQSWFQNRRDSKATAEDNNPSVHIPAPLAVQVDWTKKRKLPIRVLSIDGGGIHGIIPALVLDYIEKKTKRRIADMFDILVGTSVGGMISSALLVPDQTGRPKYTAADCLDMCSKNATRLFPTSVLRTIATTAGLGDARYPSDGIEDVLQQYFQEYTMKDALRDLVIPSYDIELRKTIFFKSRQARKDEAHNYKIWQVCRAASASPTYFEPAKIPTTQFLNDPDLKNKHFLYCIDAGLYANSPAMCAYAEVMRHNYGRLQTHHDMLLVSLGTGFEDQTFSFDEAKHWGLLQWAKPVLDIMMQASSSSVNYQLSQLLEPEQYYRFNTTLEPGRSTFDDASGGNIEYLSEVGLAMIERDRERLDTLCDILVEQADLEDSYRKRREAAGTVKGTFKIHPPAHSTDELLKPPKVVINDVPI